MKGLKHSQRDLQVAFLSGYDFSEYDLSERLAKADCAFACLVKPCDLASLEAIVQDAFGYAPRSMPF